MTLFYGYKLPEESLVYRNASLFIFDFVND